MRNMISYIKGVELTPPKAFPSKLWTGNTLEDEISAISTLIRTG